MYHTPLYRVSGGGFYKPRFKVASFSALDCSRQFETELRNGVIETRSMITQITKRNGMVVPFDLSKIAIAMKKASAAVQNPIDDAILEQMVNRVVANLGVVCEGKGEGCPTVEQVQDIVENTLMERG
jgi:transcriptional regulator NrdR family protein